MFGIIVNLTKKYWMKNHPKKEEEILNCFDKWKRGTVINEEDYIYFKVHGVPKKKFIYVVPNLGGKLRGSFKKLEVVNLNQKQLRRIGFNNDFKSGPFVKCHPKTWNRLKREIPRKMQRGFKYISLDSSLILDKFDI